MTTLQRLIREAVATRDPEKVSRVAEHMRLDLNLNYHQSFEQVSIACPEVDLAEWDAMLAESE